MIRVLLSIFLVCISSICLIYYGSPSVIKNFYTLKLAYPKTWGKVELVEEKPIRNIKDFFGSEFVWQILEQLIGFLTGILICVLIGWRVTSYRNFYEKSFENSLAECLQRQKTTEKQLSALELQIVEFERSCLSAKNEPTLSSQETSTDTLGAQPNVEVVEIYNKTNQRETNESLVDRAVDVILNDFEATDSKRILEKLTKILETLKNSNKESNCSASDMVRKEDKEAEPEDDLNVEIVDTEVLDAVTEEYYKKEEVVDTKVKAVEENKTVKNGENETETHPEDVGEVNHTYSNGSGEYSPYDIHPCESEETFRVKIVPVSQIPKYQDFQRIPKQKAKPQKGGDDEKLIPFVEWRNTPDQMSGRVTPKCTPRKNNTVLIDNKVDLTAARGGRKKQRT